MPDTETIPVQQKAPATDPQTSTAQSPVQTPIEGGTILEWSEPGSSSYLKLKCLSSNEKGLADIEALIGKALVEARTRLI
jgi:hypothetical protein